jgi:chromate transport protein ChrA
MLKLLTPLLTSLAAGEVGLAVDRIKRSAVFLTLIGLLGAIAAIFLLLAAYIALSERYGELRAALYMGGGAIVLAIVLYIIMRISDAVIRKRQRDRAKTDTSALLAVAAVAAAPMILRSRALLMLAIPAIAFGGLSVLGKKPKTRRRRRRSSEELGD